MTWYSPRRPLRSHSLVCSKNHLFIVGIGLIRDKELQFILRPGRSDRTCVLCYVTVLYDTFVIHSIWILSVLYHILTYFLYFENYFHYNIYAIILIILQYNTGPSCCIFVTIYNKFVVLTTDKPRLFTVVIWLHRVLCQQYGQMLRLRDLPTQR